MGYTRESLTIFKEHALILAKMARSAGTAGEKHDLYIQALRVYREATEHADILLHDVQTTTSIHDQHGVSLPMQRECAEIKLLAGEHMIEMMSLYASEERQKQIQEQRKGSVIRVLEELVQESPDYNASMKDWVMATK